MSSIQTIARSFVQTTAHKFVVAEVESKRVFGNVVFYHDGLTDWRDVELDDEYVYVDVDTDKIVGRDEMSDDGEYLAFEVRRLLKYLDSFMTFNDIDDYTCHVRISPTTISCRHMYAEDMQRIASAAPGLAVNGTRGARERISFRIPGAVVGGHRSTEFVFTVTNSADVCVLVYESKKLIYGLLMDGVVGNM